MKTPAWPLKLPLQKDASAPVVVRSNHSIFSVWTAKSAEPVKPYGANVLQNRMPIMQERVKTPQRHQTASIKFLNQHS